MDVVLGLSMAPSAVRIALVEGADADGVIVEEDSFRLARATADTCASDQVISAILGTREGIADAGMRLSSIGVSWTDQIQAASLREALVARKVENVMLVSAFLAAVAMGQAVGGAVGYERTGVLFIEPDSATLAIVDTADGSLCDVRRLELSDEDDTAVAELAALVSQAESMPTRPDGLYVIGSGVDVPLIKPALEAATTLTVSVPEEHEMALARGAALASGNSPLFAATTAAMAYAQDPEGLEDTAEAEVSADHDVDDEPEPQQRRALLVGSGLAVVAIAAVVALEVALAINIRPTVAMQPRPSENHFVAPALPPELTEAAPQHKINLPGPVSIPRPATQQRPATAPAVPAAPAPAAPAAPAPAVPVPVVVPPVIPAVVPPIQAPESLLRPPVAQAPVQVPQLIAPHAPVQVAPPGVQNPVPQAPVRQNPPGLGASPNPGRGPLGGGGPGGFGGQPGGGLPGVGVPGRGPFGGEPGGGVPGVGVPGRGPFGGEPGGGMPGRGPFGGGGPGAHGPFGGGGGPFGGGGPGGGFGGGHGPFGGGGGPFGGGGHGPFGGGGGPFGGGHGGGGFGGFGGGGHGGFGGFGGFGGGHR